MQGDFHAIMLLGNDAAGTDYSGHQVLLEDAILLCPIGANSRAWGGAKIYHDSRLERV